MKRFKNFIRIIFLSVTIIFAAAGAGLFGVIIPVYRERFRNNEVRIEMVDKKKTKEKKDENLNLKA